MKGVICFFDILGYQSFLENHSGEESARQVLKLIHSTPHSVSAALSKSLWKAAGGEDPVFKKVLGTLKHLVFSDTIVLLLPYPVGSDTRTEELAMSYMSLASAVLTKEMFLLGLPLRGVVHEGEFIAEAEACFAGRGIVEAYRLCNCLDFSGLIASECAAARIRGSTSVFGMDHEDAFLVDILTPQKGGVDAKFLHLNWVCPFTPAQLEELQKDVIQAVMKSFWAHQKDCPQSADSKVRNTCKIIRRLMISDDKRRLAVEKERKQNAKTSAS